MASPSINHAGYQSRLDAIDRILKSHGLEATSVTPLEYDPTLPFAYNNFLYKVTLAAPLAPSSLPQLCAGTTPPPVQGVSTLILRLPNPLADGLNTPAVRVANDVAAQHLLRRHLQRSESPLVGLLPAIYAWSTGENKDEGGVAWSMSEFRTGSPPNPHGGFDDLGEEVQIHVIDTMAGIVAALQSVPLPKTLPEGHIGGLKFSPDGGDDEVIASEMTVLPAGPWTGYVDFWKSCLEDKLDEAERNEHVRGWSEGVNRRVRAFIHGGGVGRVLEGVDLGARSLVHGDLTTNNILIDAETKQVSAILDFDWSCITHPSREYISGLDDLGSCIFGSDPDSSDIRRAVLTGTVDSSAGTPGNEAEIGWKTAKRMDAALRDKGALRPCDMAGVDRILLLENMARELCPGWATFPLGPGGGVDEKKAEGEERLAVLLQSVGA